MEPACRFGLEYTPTKGQDKVLEIHLRNCEDCQGQFEVLG